MHENNKNYTDENEDSTPLPSTEETGESSEATSLEGPDKKNDMDAELIAEGYEPYQPKLTEKQRKIVETIAGLVAGFLIWFALGLSSMDQDNTFLRWLFLIIFAGIMVAKNQIEKRTGLVLRTFMKFFLIGLGIFLGVFVIYGLASGLLF